VIGITGIIEMYQGKPEIKVLSMSQIKVADSQPVAQ
jgi:DNA/RNA endonuclease YhcR with UshA esterase domain